MLKTGDIIALKAGHRVYVESSESLEPVLVDASLAGRYVVTKTSQDGGGVRGHDGSDIFPDGHHVFCERLDDRKTKVHFYQTGCFTAMIKNIVPESEDSD